MQHAAQVTAQWLDNNQDGSIDDDKIAAELKQKTSILLMSATLWADYPESQDVEEKMNASVDGELVTQDLSAEETNPGNGERDVSQEEVQHLIQTSGWLAAYPEIFDDASGSKLFSLWKTADENKYYVYEDPTCDSGCKTFEFIYKALAVYHNARDDFDRDDEISFTDKEDMDDKLPGLSQLIESSDYEYAKWMWPDGNYKYKNQKIRYYGSIFGSEDNENNQNSSNSDEIGENENEEGNNNEDNEGSDDKKDDETRDDEQESRASHDDDEDSNENHDDDGSDTDSDNEDIDDQENND